MVKELDCQWSLLLIVIHLNLGSKLVCAIAVDVTKVDSTEAWWNQSTLHSMAQRRGGVRVLSTTSPGGWGQEALHSMAQRPGGWGQQALHSMVLSPGGVRELWLNFHVA